MQNSLKKKPERTCTGCSQSKNKDELIRVVRTPEGEICLDLSGKMSGRGAYICPDPECLKKAKKNRRLQRNLNVEIPDEIFSKLEAEVIKNV